MSIQEFLQISAFVIIVMVIAYVARRFQAVGLPPSAKTEEKVDRDESEQ